jgi:hypothetical protein
MNADKCWEQQDLDFGGLCFVGDCLFRVRAHGRRLFFTRIGVHRRPSAVPCFSFLRDAKRMTSPQRQGDTETRTAKFSLCLSVSAVHSFGRSKDQGRGPRRLLDLDTAQTYSYDSLKKWLTQIPRGSSATEKAQCVRDDATGQATKMSCGKRGIGGQKWIGQRAGESSRGTREISIPSPNSRNTIKGPK